MRKSSCALIGVKAFFLAILILAAGRLGGQPAPPAGGSPANEAAKRRAVQMLQSGPAVFIENKGQWPDASIRFALTGQGANVGLTSGSLRFQLFRRVPAPAGSPSSMAGPSPMRSRLRPGAEGPTSPTVTRMMEFKARFKGARPVQPAGQTPSAQRINFRRGESSRWREGVPAWESVRYKGLYEGIDLLVAGRKEGMKYEFHLAPGADWKQIQLSYEGISALEIRADWALVLTPAAGWPALVDGAPVIYQESDTGQRQSVAGRFRLTNPFTVGFEVTGAYDHQKPLIIDPELAWSTYLGGGNAEFGYGITVDGSGNVYATGSTQSAGWLGSGSLQGGTDTYVIKFSPAGQSLWSSYLGGNSDDSGTAIAVDHAGNVLVTGITYSEDSWVSGGYSTTHFGGGADAFVVKLNSAGQHLWSTYVGGRRF